MLYKHEGILFFLNLSFSKNKFITDVLCSSNPIVPEKFVKNNYNTSNNLKLLNKDKNTYLYEVHFEENKPNKIREPSENRKIANAGVNNSNAVKESMAFDKSGISERDTNKINNTSYDYFNFNKNDEKKHNKMKFQHFYYEPAKGYYI